MEANQKYKIAKAFFPHYEKEFCFKLVEVIDAEFILKLRTDPKLNSHLSKTDNKIENQIAWLKEYKKREKQGLEFYIICTDKTSGAKLGLNRLYEFKDAQFEIGSWLYQPDLKVPASIIGDLIIRSFAFELLGFNKCIFNVRKTNKTVLRYHTSFKPEILFEDDLNIYFQIDYHKFNVQKHKLLKILGYE
jgi:hypothetical protein